MSSIIITSEGFGCFINGKAYNCSSDHEHFAQAVELARQNRWDKIPPLLSIRQRVASFVSEHEDIEVHQDHVTYKGKRVHGAVVDRILAMIREGLNANPLANFLNNLYQNPSGVAVKELYLFLEHAQLPITEDGHFLAYKRVNDDYTSCYDNTTPNNIGSVLEMERFLVDSDRDNTCSNGFHFCSFDYLSSFRGDRTLILKINPRDVVTIPSDYRNTKGRACRYLIEGEVDNAADRNFLGEVGSVVESSAVVPTADKYDNYTSIMTPIDDQNQCDAAIAAYSAGYKAGRNKTDSAALVLLHSQHSDMFNLGYKDGKAHAPRKYKAPKASK